MGRNWKKDRVRLRSRAFVEPLEHRRLFNAVLAADINTAPGNNWAPQELASFGNVAYFAANDGVHGIELWKTDGTTGGTTLVKDIATGLSPSRPAGFAQTTDGTVYFSAGTAGAGNELWKTDGTEAGTVRVKDINPGALSSSPNFITAFGNKVYFFADDGTHGRELWMSDGTDAGTQLIKDIQPGTTGQSVRGLAVCNGALYFAASAGNTSVTGLWKSSGAVGDATFVTSVPGFFVSQLTPFGNQIYFTDPSGELYVSTGDVGNKTLVQSFSSSIDRFVNANGTLFFDRQANAGAGLYRISGSTANLISGVSQPTAIGNLGGDLYASGASVSTSAGLFRVTSGASTATLVTGFDPGTTIANMTGVGLNLFFTEGTSATGYRLRTTKGAGAAQLQTVTPAGNLRAPKLPAVVNGRFVILADDPAIGQEFWTSDGTTPGSHLLKDIFPGTSDSSPLIWAALNNVLLMTARDNIVGNELWSLDANGNATVLKDINPGTGNSNPASLYVAGDQAFFSATDGTTGSELYVTDGTPAGTRLVRDINPNSSSSDPGHFIAYNGRVYFDATDAVHGEEMWVTDGTPQGTSIFNDFSGGSGGFSNPCVMNGILYFAANDAMGTELWRTDGTPQGTYRVKDIFSGSSSSSPSLLTAYNGMLYFVATDSLGAELWKSDGSDTGTARVMDIQPGGNGASINSMVVAGAYLYFTADNGTIGRELWRTDGTANGTIPLGDLRPGSAASSPFSLTAMNDRLYFFITNAAGGYDLWQSAGTPQTTTFLKNIGPIGVLAPGAMVVSSGRLMFLGDQVDTVEGVWSSDGTPQGTAPVPSTDPGGFPEVDTPRLVPFAGQVYAAGDDGVSGIEPWRYTDDWAPVVWKQSFDERSAPSVSITFNENVNPALVNIQLMNLTTGEQISPDRIKTTYDSITYILTATFGGASAIPHDGNYHLTLAAGSVVDIAGNATQNDLTYDFFFLAGDANHDRTIDFSDLVTVAQNYGQSGKTFEQGDFNFDGSVGFADLVVIAQKYGTSLPAAADPSASSSSLVIDPLSKKPAVFKAPIITAKPPAPQKPTRPVFASRRLP